MCSLFGGSLPPAVRREKKTVAPAVKERDFLLRVFDEGAFFAHSAPPGPEKVDMRLRNRQNSLVCSEPCLFAVDPERCKKCPSRNRGMQDLPVQHTHPPLAQARQLKAAQPQRPRVGSPAPPGQQGGRPKPPPCIFSTTTMALTRIVSHHGPDPAEVWPDQLLQVNPFGRPTTLDIHDSCNPVVLGNL